MSLGKKLYKTSMLNGVRLFLLVLVFFFFRDFYLETYSEPKFIEMNNFSILGVAKFYYMYPHELIILCFMVFFPAIYYGFVRGTVFYSEGLTYNRGIPFLNTYIPYKKIKSYKLLHPKTILSIKLENGDVYVIVDNKLDRVVAFLDQQEIQGNLAQDEYVTLLRNFKKFIIAIAVFTLALILVRKFGIFKTYF